MKKYFLRIFFIAFVFMVDSRVWLSQEASASPELLLIVQEEIRSPHLAQYDELETKIARDCVSLQCPHPYLALVSTTEPKVVWWLNAFASSAEKTRVEDAWQRNTAAMQALNVLGQQKQAFTSKPRTYLTHCRRDLSKAAWTMAGARFLIVRVTNKRAPVGQSVFTAPDGKLFVFAAATTRQEAEQLLRLAGAGAQLLAVQPRWSLPASEWIAADPEFWQMQAAQLGRRLLERALQAMGGAEKLAAVKDVMHQMEITLAPTAGGFKLKQTSFFVAPNFIRQEQEMPFGKVLTFTDGKTGWLVTPQSAQPIPADVLRVAQGVIFRQPATLLLSDRDATRIVRAVGENAVEIVTAEGLRVRLEFDATTGLLARQLYTEAGANGSPHERVETFSDWRDVNGIKMPFKAVQQEDGAPRLELIVSEYRINSGLTAEQLSRRP